LVVLPTEVYIDIAGHLAATSERAMDDLRSLQATCREMHCVCTNAAVGRHVALERFAIELQWNDRKGYDALLDCLTYIRNPEACFLSGMDILFGENYSSRSSIAKLEEEAQARHNVADYIAAMVLYRANGGTGDDDTARLYIREVEGEEELAVVASMMMRTNKGCLRCREAAS
jgi:hypothetical protein